MTRLIAIMLIFVVWSASAATRLVPSQHATIQAAHDASSSGDIIRVSDGTYNERVTMSTSGLTFIGNATGTGVVMRGFTVSGADNWKVIGFEITHTDTTQSRAILLNGTCTNWLIADNYIHDNHLEAIQTQAAAASGWGTIRGNQIYYIAHPGSLQPADVAIAGSLNTHRWVIEYNHIERASDFIDLYGTNHIFRNNWMHNYRDAYWSVNGHPDFFQPGSDGTQTFTRHHVYEANFCGDAPSAEAHWALWQNQSNFGDTNMLMRGNVGYDIGNAGVAIIQTDKVQTYNNTFHDMLNQSAGHIWNWYSDITVGGLLINSVSSDFGVATLAINIETPDNQVTASHNWGYQSGSHASFLGTTDPLFVAPGSQDFRLQSGSPLRGVGTHITTITNGDGSGASFGVPDSHRLIDGWNLVEGDIISFPGGGTARITFIDITNNIITVASSITWTNNQRVYFGPRGYQADIGALPFNAAPLTAASLSRVGTTYTVTPVGDARGVWFYVDGIPTTWDYDAPYQTTIASGTVTAKAYAYYAQTWPVVNASDVGETGTSPYRNRGQAVRMSGVTP